MERRRHPRVEVDHAVLFHSDIYRNPKVASTFDLSLGGMKIESLHSLNSQEGLEISIAIQPQVISCRGKVIYVVEREKGRIEAGIEFEGLSEPDSIYLKEYLFDLRVKRVVDGDTLLSANGERVRLIGVDTPEVHKSKKLYRDAERTGRDIKTIKALGRKASALTKSLVYTKEIRLEYDQAYAHIGHRDKYGRILAHVYLKDGTSEGAVVETIEEVRGAINRSDHYPINGRLRG